MPVIACGINAFDYDQSVIIINDDNSIKILGKSTYQNLDHFITTCCNKNNIYQVQLNGLKQYTKPLKERIEKEGIARYGKKIEVKINE